MASDGFFQRDTATDTRQVRIPTYQGGTAGVKGNAKRSNPLAWYDRDLCRHRASGIPPLAIRSPARQFLGYTCYATDASGSNAAAMINLLSFNTDYVNTFTAPAPTARASSLRVGAGFANSPAGSASNIGLPQAGSHAVRDLPDGLGRNLGNAVSATASCSWAPRGGTAPARAGI